MTITFEAYTTKTLAARLHRARRLRLSDTAGTRLQLHRTPAVSLESSRAITAAMTLRRAPRARLSDAAGGAFVMHREAQLNLSGSAPVPTATVFQLSAPARGTRMAVTITHHLDMAFHRQPRALLVDGGGARFMLRRTPRLLVRDGAAGSARTAFLLQQPELVANVVPGFTLALSDRFQASASPDTDLIHALLDLIVCSDSYSTIAAALQTLADGASLADVAQMIIAADLLDSFIASVVQDGTAQLTVMLADGLLAGDSASSLSEILAALADGFYATLTVATGDDVWTAWVMTTQTKAMRRYTNWAFNSYAMLGGAFLGAGPEGIYRMGGDTDAGDAIRWAIRTGKLNFASDQMKGVPLVHIGATTSGNLLLRVRATTVRNQEIEQTYRMTPAVTGAAREHRVPVGAGFRSVYWTFEIANDDDGAAATVHEWHAVPVQHTGKLL